MVPVLGPAYLRRLRSHHWYESRSPRTDVGVLIPSAVMFALRLLWMERDHGRESIRWRTRTVSQTRFMQLVALYKWFIAIQRWRQPHGLARFDM